LNHFLATGKGHLWTMPAGARGLNEQSGEYREGLSRKYVRNIFTQRHKAAKVKREELKSSLRLFFAALRLCVKDFLRPQAYRAVIYFLPAADACASSF
jgi:hypothetical protein